MIRPVRCILRFFTKNWITLFFSQHSFSKRSFNGGFIHRNIAVCWDIYWLCKDIPKNSFTLHHSNWAAWGAPCVLILLYFTYVKTMKIKQDKKNQKNLKKDVITNCWRIEDFTTAQCINSCVHLVYCVQLWMCRQVVRVWNFIQSLSATMRMKIDKIVRNHFQIS